SARSSSWSPTESRTPRWPGCSGSPLAPCASTSRTRTRSSGFTRAPARWPRWAVRLGQLLADQLANHRAVGAAGDLRHHVRHHASEVAHARRPDLGDRVVDDLLELVL